MLTQAPMAKAALKPEKITELLRSKGLKASKARLGILKALGRAHCPVSVEELFKKLPSGLCDLATLYRSLASFEEKSILVKIVLGDGQSRYEWAEQKNHHHHVVCRVCRKIKPISFCGLKNLEKQIQKLGYSNIHHSLEFFATCSKCQVTS